LCPNTFLHYSWFYEYSKSCVMEGEVFTTNDRTPHTSMITAIRPTKSLTSITRSKQVGRITKFIRHKVKVATHVKPFVEEKYHIFCSMDWYIKHVREDWYGCSAIVCNSFTYSDCNCSFMPIQRILAGAHLEQLTPSFHQEKLFVAIPVLLKH